MKIKEFISFLETVAPLSLQESYDNAGLITGHGDSECTGVLTTLDATEDVIEEAKKKNCNLIVAHHPIIFGSLKKITGKNYVEKTVINAIKNDIAIYAIHTNLDNVLHGVNGRIADKLGLGNRRILKPASGPLKKLITFVPLLNAESVRQAIFAAGGGSIGNYSECSFNSSGEGTFKGNDNATPYVGNIGERHTEQEVKIEIIFPEWMKDSIINAMLESHPYEEVAYDIIPLNNEYQQIGAGLIGELKAPVDEIQFLGDLKDIFKLSVIRHTKLSGRKVKKVAICGGAGSFLIGAALAQGADFYVTGDVKYHEFFDANDRLVIADIGHYESEQFTIDLLFDILREKFPTFAVLKTGINTNPVNYFG